MSRGNILIALGVLVVLSPYLGLPYSWLMFLVPVLGLLVLGIGISLRIKRRVSVPEAASYETGGAV